MFVTADRNLTFQQKIAAVEVAIVVLAARGNRLEDLLPLVPALQRAIDAIEPGQIVRLGV